MGRFKFDPYLYLADTIQVGALSGAIGNIPRQANGEGQAGEAEPTDGAEVHFTVSPEEDLTRRVDALGQMPDSRGTNPVRRRGTNPQFGTNKSCHAEATAAQNRD